MVGAMAGHIVSTVRKERGDSEDGGREGRRKGERGREGGRDGGGRERAL